MLLQSFDWLSSMSPPGSIFYSLLLVVKELVDTVVGIVFGATPSQMSLLYFLHYLHCAGGWSVIVDPDTKGYAQEWRIEVQKIIIIFKNIFKFLSLYMFLTDSKTC